MRFFARNIGAVVIFLCQLLLVLPPGMDLFNAHSVLAALRVPLILGLWAVLGVLLYRNFRKSHEDSGKIYEQHVNHYLSSFVRALVQFSTGNLSTGISLAALQQDETGILPDRMRDTRNLLMQEIEEFNAITSTPLKRLCFTGDNSFHEGLMMGEQIHRALGNSGVLLIVIPFFSQVLHALRAKGCISYLQQAKTNIRILPVVEGRGNGQQTVEILKPVFEKEPDISCVYLSDGVTPVSVESWLSDRGLDKQVALFAHDLTEENIGLFERTTLKCLLAENFFAQTYNALVYLYNALEAGWKPVSYKVYLNPLVVTAENYRQYWDSKSRGRLLTQEETAVLEKPVEKRSGKQWKIYAILPTAGSFFVMGTKVAEEAKKRLAEYGVSIEIIDTFKDWASFATREAMEPWIREARTKGAHGISTAVFDRNLVPVINEAVESGIKVTTFNSEPLNLREIILNVANNIIALQESSAELASSAEESARANNQIVRLMNNIEQSTSVQNTQLEKTENSFTSLNHVITNVSGIVDSYMGSVERVNQEVVKGVERLSESNQSVLELKESLRNITRQLESLQADMSRIGNIVSMIDSFSTDTNVLAINASIQAARAGERGMAFTVVANEIRSLSEKSSAATEEINRIIAGIQSSVKNVVGFSGEKLKMVEVDSERLSRLDEAFQTIRAHIDESSHSIKSIHQMIGQAAESSGSLKEAMLRIGQMNKANLQSIQEISESLRELSVQSSELSHMASRYLEMANNQEQVISQLTF